MTEIVINGRPIGAGHPPFIIAEVGINHNGVLAQALAMVRVAKAAGADAVKFQTFKAAEFVGNSEQLFTYRSQGKEVTESMLAMFQRYELPRQAWSEIKAECDAQGITFMSTPQNRSDLDLLLEIGVPAIKVGSDDFTNLPLIRRYAETGLPLILSCGMSDLAEVHEALDAAGALDGYAAALLLCTSQYPTPPEDVNLRKLKTLQAAFPDLVVGFSDHTQGPLASSLAVAMGAVIFEKHFTLDHGLPGPDHWFSENPESLQRWVDGIRCAGLMLGRPLIRPTSAELANKKEFQRVIVSAKPISTGEFFSSDNLCMRRVPGGNGLPPRYIDLLIGRGARRSYEPGEPIEL
jgi:N,N'-diacetyllegionaminate synthase